MWDDHPDRLRRLRLRGHAQFNHVPGGANVLFMDGHVEFLKWSGRFGNRFPVNRAGALFHEASHRHEHVHGG
jgi:prepilin-type processing-associated H-X9-DG protein